MLYLHPVRLNSAVYYVLKVSGALIRKKKKNDNEQRIDGQLQTLSKNVIILFFNSCK